MQVSLYTVEKVGDGDENSNKINTKGDKDESDTQLSGNMVSENEHELLQKFRKKKDNIQYNTCNERIPSMIQWR